jgi:hypothetical protein
MPDPKANGFVCHLHRWPSQHSINAGPEGQGTQEVASQLSLGAQTHDLLEKTTQHQPAAPWESTASRIFVSGDGDFHLHRPQVAAVEHHPN